MAAKSGMFAVMKFFGSGRGTKPMTPTQFKSEWGKLTDYDKEQLKSGIGEYDEVTGTVSGTLAY